MQSIAFETTEMAVKDLDNYYNALDGALQNFHSQKITEINKIIRELWQLIYKGVHVCMFVCRRVCLYVMYVCMCVYVCIYGCMRQSRNFVCQR